MLSSIEGADAREWVVGTRYHTKDLYNDLMEMKEVLYDDQGEQAGEDQIYEIFEKPVENRGDGTGEFLWPKQQRKDGKWFGFDIATLAKKRGKYLDKGQFRAQYYNDPSDPDNVPVTRDKIQYFDRKHVVLDNGFWYYRGNKLNLFAAIDFAFSTRAKADYTALVLVGVDADNNVYILDIDRFRTERISEYFDHIFDMHDKWSFRKLRAEVTVAQMAIVKQLKDLIKEHGLALSIDEFRPNKQQGNKQERIAAVLEPRYDNLQMWHYRGGNTQYLEDELSSRNPPHDDVIDALASAVDMAVRPTRNLNRKRDSNIVWANSRFRAGSR